MPDVVNGVYNAIFDDVTIVDRRYPYQFEGGYIRWAVNLFTKDDVIALFGNLLRKTNVTFFAFTVSSKKALENPTKTKTRDFGP
ncbi:hypothetical protein DPMN_090935 [Dreissena polymorpha]|uniref:Uncharacterized protein n=1 Tax=Dreissena polymorpha TaxID=45954 RepID=A0A9D4KYM9_DREPO|nr:hypothetical protein DPMN_090935 [Dreissena polymorpha]